MAVPNNCARGDYDCQAQAVCESVTAEPCVFQQYDCAFGVNGSYYPISGIGGSDFNFSLMDVQWGNYGNVCGCNEPVFDGYGLARLYNYCGLGYWQQD
jgi:hypothetical protein